MLNRAKPFAEVWGMPGVRFEQDGRLYRADGMPVGGAPAAPAVAAEGAMVSIAAGASPDVLTIDGATEGDRTGEMSRAEIMAELRRRKVKFAATKSTPVLQAILDAEREKEGQA